MNSKITLPFLLLVLLFLLFVLFYAYKESVEERYNLFSNITNVQNNLSSTDNVCTYQVINKDLYCSTGYRDVYKQSLILNYSTGEQKTIYTTREPKENNCELGPEFIDDTVTVSPNCTQVSYRIISWETLRDFLVDTNSGDVIISSSENWRDSNNFGYIEDIKWSPSGKYFVLEEEPNIRAGWGQKAIYLGDSDGTVVKIHTEESPPIDFIVYRDIFDIKVDDNGVVSFYTKFNPERQRLPDGFLQENGITNNSVYYTYDYHSGKLNKVD